MFVDLLLFAHMKTGHYVEASPAVINGRGVA